MALAKCEDCGHQVSTEAAACPSCGRPMNAAPAPTPTSVQPPPPIVPPQQQPAAPAQPTIPKRKNWFRRHPILTVILAVIVLGIIGAAASNGNKKHGSGSSGASANNPSTAASTPITPATSTPPASNMTVAQQQAVESAKNYLSMGKGFSRAGLIKQLSSSYGERFPKAVAIFAVDHLNVNWNEQAVESAKSYVSMGSGFSRAGLIQQLSSSYGEGFTYAQAVYAANKVGL